MKIKWIPVLLLLCSQQLISQETPALITTVGEALEYAVPNEIIISTSVDTEGSDLVEAKTKNDKISREVIQYLRDQGIEERHIQSDYLRVNKYFRNRNFENPQFSARQSIRFCIRDLEKYESIVMGLLKLGVQNIGNPQFRTTKLQEIKTTARMKAIQAAKEKASMLAEVLGQKIGKAYSIKEVRQSFTGNQGAYANTVSETEGTDLGGQRSFAPGQMEVRARIEVSFLLE